MNNQSTDSVLACTNVVKTFRQGKNDVPVLRGIDFTLQKGETIAIPQEGAPGQMCEVPTPLITLNRDIIRTLTGADVNELSLTAMTGYRHKRSTVRLESTADGARRIIHNYGHGGAGVTLSWSCALRAAVLTGAEAGEEEIEALLMEAARR